MRLYTTIYPKLFPTLWIVIVMIATFVKFPFANIIPIHSWKNKQLGKNIHSYLDNMVGLLKSEIHHKNVRSQLLDNCAFLLLNNQSFKKLLKTIFCYPEI